MLRRLVSETTEFGRENFQVHRVPSHKLSPSLQCQSSSLYPSSLHRLGSPNMKCSRFQSPYELFRTEWFFSSRPQKWIFHLHHPPFPQSRSTAMLKGRFLLSECSLSWTIVLATSQASSPAPKVLPRTTERDAPTPPTLVRSRT